MQSFQPQMGILPPAQTSLWPKLRPIKKLGFVLYGGTAFALQIGHRESVDFDFFSSTLLNREKLREVCPWLVNATTLQDEPNTWTVLTDRSEAGVKISFFGGLKIGRVGEPMVTADQVLTVGSLEHDPFTLYRLAASKLGEGAVFECAAVQVPEARKYGDFAQFDAVAKRFGAFSSGKLVFACPFNQSALRKNKLS